MTFHTEIDIVGTTSVSELLELFHKHGSPSIVKYQASGPAGGNPAMTLSFPLHEDALKFLIEFFPKGEDITFLETQIAEVK